MGNLFFDEAPRVKRDPSTYQRAPNIKLTDADLGTKWRCRNGETITIDARSHYYGGTFSCERRGTLWYDDGKFNVHRQPSPWDLMEQIDG